MGIVFVLVVFASIICRHTFAAGGEPVVYFPPFELRTVAGDGPPYLVPVTNGVQPQSFQDGREQRTLLHTSAPHQQDQHQHHMTPPEPEAKGLPPSQEHNRPDDNSTVNVHQLLHALGIEEDHEHEEKEHSRAAARDYEYPPYSSYPAPSYTSYSPYPHPPSYGYPSKYPSSYPPSYSGPPPSYPPPAAYVPPTTAHTSLKPVISKLPDLAKPLATKVAGKVGGLISLILTLLTGSSPDKLELGGLRDVVINGIIKPLLVAKGGLKTLISKMGIPVISLLLINLEILITVWWLWEDCPQHEPYQYSKPTYTSNYNPYR